MSRSTTRPPHRIEMHLVAESPQQVRLGRLGVTIRLSPGESIWTESSYKFTREDAAAMLEAAGLRLHAWHVDAQGEFGMALAGPAPVRAAAAGGRSGLSAVPARASVPAAPDAVA